MSTTELGCGLLAMGRPWGSPTPKQPPSFEESQKFLDTALENGVEFYDTAKAYGSSERRLGEWVAGLEPGDRKQVHIATKVGEFWNSQRGWINHEYESMKGALDRSLDMFGDTLELVQIHQASSSVMKLPDIDQLHHYAQSRGIEHFGASVKTPQDVQYCIDDDRVSHIQIPAGVYIGLEDQALKRAAQSDKTIIVNRPFGMGSLLEESGPEECFRTILDRGYDGHLIVLTGTANPDHLAQNVCAFNQVFT